MINMQTLIQYKTKLSCLLCSYSAEDIVTLTRMEYHLPPKSVVLFSNKSPFYITGQNSLTPEQFKELLDDAGLTEGYALLYLLPITQLSPDKFIPDYSNIALLSKSNCCILG